MRRRRPEEGRPRPRAASGGAAADGEYAARRLRREKKAKTRSPRERHLPPRITSSLWDHQSRSVAATLAGVKGGKLGFADASAVGAGKTLTALATVVELASHLDAASAAAARS